MLYDDSRGRWVETMTTKAIILDTDIGTDVDDCLALALCLVSSELKLTAVTTVYGDARLRALIVLKLLALRDVNDVPVAVGAEKPLLDRVPIYWEGHEGQGILTPEDSALTPVSEHAADLIARTVMAQPGEIILIAIGPLTNVALGHAQGAAAGACAGWAGHHGRRDRWLARPAPAVDGTQLPFRSRSRTDRPGTPARRWRSYRWMSPRRCASVRWAWRGSPRPTRRSISQ